MYNIVIVDDEIHAVEGIKIALDWDKLGISGVYTAYNIRQAKEVFDNNKIHILLCDIEMPQGNGLELLTWVRENYPQTISVFLTCHAEFDYAKQAIRLGCMDYLLKPVPYDELQTVVEKAVREIENSMELKEYSQYGENWVKSRPVLIENFWSDIMNHNIASVPELIKEAAVTRNIPYDEGMKHLPILIIQQQWNTELNPVEKKMARIEFKNFVREMVIQQEGQGEIIKLAHRRYLAILYREQNSSYEMGKVVENCRSFIKRCSEKLSCDISCYIGEEIYSHELLEMVDKLASLEENFTAIHNRVYQLNQKEQAPGSIKMPDMSLWSVMLADGAKDKVIDEANHFVNGLMKESRLDKSTLLHFQHDYLQMIYAYLKQTGMHAHQLLSDSEDVQMHENALRSEANLTCWVKHVTDKALSYAASLKESQSVVEKTKQFIALNLDKDLSRESIANHVFLNSDYLTRIFKRDTGMSISEYIVMERIRIAKDLLTKTDMAVSGVAARVGYTNFSHFAKMFKKYTDVTPMDYRQKNVK